MTKKIKKHIKRRYIKPVAMTEEERSLVETERLHAAALTHQIGELLGKHLKKKFPKGVPEDQANVFAGDAYASFLNDVQLMMINGFGLSADEIINVNMDMLPSKLSKLNITSDDKKSASKAVDTMYIVRDVLSGMANMFKEEQPESAEQVAGLSHLLEDSATWLKTFFKVSDAE